MKNLKEKPLVKKFWLHFQPPTYGKVPRYLEHIFKSGKKLKIWKNTFNKKVLAPLCVSMFQMIDLQKSNQLNARHFPGTHSQPQIYGKVPWYLEHIF